MKNSVKGIWALPVRGCSHITSAKNRGSYNFKILIFGKISDFWKNFRFSENFQIFGKISDFWETTIATNIARIANAVTITLYSKVTM